MSFTRGVHYPKRYHRNEQAPPGPCHYYWSRSEHRMIFRQSEIKFVDPTPLGALVVTHSGCEYKVTQPKPDRITLESDVEP